jgi:hypothetical protein
MRSVLYAALLAVTALSLFAHAQISTNTADNTVTVESAPEMDVFSYGRTVVIKHEAKSVLTFGADIIIEGRVEGDVAAFGGSITQKQNAFIGGDVIVIGGKYRPESAEPLRNAGKQTVMIAGNEEEVRNLVQSPSQIFSPSMSLTFLALRILAILFWFLISLAFVTVAPGAVSRAVARINLFTTKVIAIGFFAFLFTSVSLIVSVSLLPSYLSAVLGLMVFVMLLLAYIFGRVALNVSVGKLVQKHLLSDKNQSETLGIFIGVVAWTVLLSVPYVWTFGLLALFSAGIGLVLTARNSTSWKTR